MLLRVWGSGPSRESTGAQGSRAQTVYGLGRPGESLRS